MQNAIELDNGIKISPEIQEIYSTNRLFDKVNTMEKIKMDKKIKLISKGK